MIESTDKENQVESGEYRMGTFARMLNVFFSPSRTFISVNQRPNWVVPLLFVLAAVLVFQMLITPVKIKEAKENIRNNPDLTSEQIEMGLERIEQFSEGPEFRTRMAMSLGVFAIAEVIKLFAVALVFLFAVKLAVSDSPFGKILGVASYVNLVSIVEMGVKLPLILAKGTMSIYTSLAVILPNTYQNSIVHRLLNSLDVFSFWRIVLFSIGLAAVTQLSSKKSAFLVIYVWIGWIIIHALFANLIQIQ